ncbi:hypothetical protein AHAS_Ahas01G0120100 [Arachis hypogaea]
MASGYKISPNLIKEFGEIESNLTLLKVRRVCCTNGLNPNDWRYKIIDFLKNLNQRIDKKLNI